MVPEGYRIPELDDIKALPTDQYYQSLFGGWKTKTSSDFFNANACGYLPFEADTIEVLSKGNAAYYWTKTDGKILHSMGYVILDGEHGCSIQELRRESFCAVRCVKNEEEASAFQRSESEILVLRKEQEEEKRLAEENARKKAEEKRLAEEKEKTFINEFEYKRTYDKISCSSNLTFQSSEKIENWIISNPYNIRYGNFIFQETTNAPDRSHNLQLINYSPCGPSYSLYSLILPGLGKYKVTYGQKGILTIGIFGATLATTLISGFYSNYMYNQYLNATSQSEIQKDYKLANNSHKIFLVSGCLTLSVYFTDVVSSIQIGRKNKSRSEKIKAQLISEPIPVNRQHKVDR